MQNKFMFPQITYSTEQGLKLGKMQNKFMFPHITYSTEQELKLGT